jgi:hypothetical protein
MEVLKAKNWKELTTNRKERNKLVEKAKTHPGFREEEYLVTNYPAPRQMTTQNCCLLQKLCEVSDFLQVSFNRRIQTGSETHQASYPCTTTAISAVCLRSWPLTLFHNEFKLWQTVKS